MSDFKVRLYPSGVLFDLVEPDPEKIFPEDIAHSLSMQCRYNGHLARHYSVAQHSVLVATCLPTPELQKWGLMHDAAEIFTGDIVGPLKKLLNEWGNGAVECLEKNLEVVVANRFDMEWPIPLEVKDADRLIYDNEVFDLREGSIIIPEKRYPAPIVPCGPRQAKIMWLQAYQALFDLDFDVEAAMGESFSELVEATVEEVAPSEVPDKATPPLRVYNPEAG